MSYKKVLASEFDVEPAYIKSMESHGLCYFTWHDCELVGAQCHNCHTVIWVKDRDNRILSEKAPPEVPDSGREYTLYYRGKLKRFLNSLPPCPECGVKNFDKFINNVKHPRLADGAPYPKDVSNLGLDYVDNTQVPIWLYEED